MVVVASMGVLWSWIRRRLAHPLYAASSDVLADSDADVLADFDSKDGVALAMSPASRAPCAAVDRKPCHSASAAQSS